MNYNEDSEGGLNDPDVATSFTFVSDPGEHGGGHGVQASSFDAVGSPPPRPHSRGYTCKPKPQYNRQTIRIEDFIGKMLENITAKQYRVLIPLMFQSLIYPNKEIAKTKVKGLWEAGNCPNAWPGNVRFRDPNNNPKFQIWESKLIFQFLRERLIQDPKYRTCLRQPVKPKTEPRKSPSPRTAETSQVIPNLPTLNPGHLGTSFGMHRESIGIQEEGADMKPILPQVPLLAMSSQYTSADSPIPTFVEQMEEGLIAKTQGVTLKEEPVQSPLTPQVGSPYCFDQEVLSSMQPQVVQVVNSDMSDNEGKTMTSLTLLQTATVPCEAQVASFPTEAQQQPNVMYVFGDENATQPVNPQSCEIQTIPGTAQPECVEFASTVQKSLLPIVTEFSQMFQSEASIMDKVEEVIGDTFVPMYNAAKCSKLTCAELSKLGGRLQEMLKRFTFMKESCRFEDIVFELDTLQADFKVQELVIDNNVPEATYEVQVMTALNDTVPALVNETNPYIPTIADLQRAQQKRMMLEKNVEAVDYVDPESKMSFDKSKSLMSPLCHGVEGMDLDETDTEQSLVDPEQDFGIKVRDGESEEKTEEHQALVQDMEKYLSEGQIWGIDVRPASSEETDEIVNILLGTQPKQASPGAVTALQDPVVPVPNGGFQQMQLDTSIMENQAVDNMMADMYSHFGGSMTSEAPLTAVTNFDDTTYLTDEVLSLMDDYEGYSLEGAIPDMVTVDVPLPVAEPPPKVELPTSPASSQREAVFAQLKSLTSSVIPTTVFEAAAAKDQVQGRKGTKPGRGKQRRN